MTDSFDEFPKHDINEFIFHSSIKHNLSRIEGDFVLNAAIECGGEWHRVQFLYGINKLLLLDHVVAENNDNFMAAMSALGADEPKCFYLWRAIEDGRVWHWRKSKTFQINASQHIYNYYANDGTVESYEIPDLVAFAQIEDPAERSAWIKQSQAVGKAILFPNLRARRQPFYQDCVAPIGPLKHS